ncbi:MAG: stage II sporulation protein D [Christensenellales bacterium]
MKKRYASKQQHSPLFWMAVILSCVLLLVLLFSGGAGNTTAQEPLKLDIRLGDITKKPLQASYPIRFYHPQTKKIEKLEIEEYVLGVVAAEMPVSYDPEALKAQAVAARTLAVYKCQNGGCSYGGDICGNSDHCQAWVSDEGMQKKWGSSYEINLAKAKEAVDSTAGEIIAYHGEPIQVLYHSTSGGITEDVENVFANALPYLRSVQSGGEEKTSHYENTVTISNKNFYSILKANYHGVDEGKGIQIVSTYDSGRVKEISAGGIKLTGKQMRALYGLDSTLFSVFCTADSVTIHTKGFGHGVGMSQVGANAMAQNGSGYIEILTHYYTDVDIVSNYGDNA